MAGQAGGTSPGAHSSFPHEVLFHAGADELGAGVAPVVQDAFEAGHVVLLAARPGTVDVVRDAVGDDPRLRVLPPTDQLAPRPPGLLDALRRLSRYEVAGGAPRVRLVGEVEAGPSWRWAFEMCRFEAACNEVMALEPVSALCLYDTRRLPAALVDSARRTHPSLAGAGGVRANPDYADQAELLRGLPVPREPAQDGPPVLVVDGITDFIGLRHRLAEVLTSFGRDRDTTEDFLLAVDEMASNGVRHGRPPVNVRLWVDEDSVVCTITDDGPGVTDPFAGYGPAHGEDLSRGGMGLWLARQLCDGVDAWRDAEGATVRLSTRLV